MKLEFVGSQIGSELRDKGEWAMLVALLSILVYIGFRFEFYMVLVLSLHSFMM